MVVIFIDLSMGYSGLWITLQCNSNSKLQCIEFYGTAFKSFQSYCGIDGIASLMEMLNQTSCKL